MTSHDIEGARARLEARIYRHTDESQPNVSAGDVRALLADHSRLLERVRELEDSSRNTGNHLCGSRDEQTGGATAALAEQDGRNLRHFAQRTMMGEIEIVDRKFNFVRCILPYDYAYTSNGQQLDEAKRICRALEGPMSALGIHTIRPTPDGALSEGGKDG
jgi:hypothetical protein